MPTTKAAINTKTDPKLPTAKEGGERDTATGGGVTVARVPFLLPDLVAVLVEELDEPELAADVADVSVVVAELESEAEVVAVAVADTLADALTLDSIVN
jgi:hypothetical protein